MKYLLVVVLAVLASQVILKTKCWKLKAYLLISEFEQTFAAPPAPEAADDKPDDGIANMIISMLMKVLGAPEQGAEQAPEPGDDQADKS